MEQDKAVPGLLEQVAVKKRKEKEEQASIEEAKALIPELESKILELLGIKIPEDEEKDTVSVHKLDKKSGVAVQKLPKGDLEKMVQNVVARMSVMFNPARRTFLVPFEEEKVEVTLTKGIRSSSFTSNVDRGLDVFVTMHDSHLRINEGMAFIISNERNIRPFDMHTPIGPGGDLGPVWSRNMNMNDFNEYDALLDRLSEPDVERQEKTS